MLERGRVRGFDDDHKERRRVCEEDESRGESATRQSEKTLSTRDGGSPLLRLSSTNMDSLPTRCCHSLPAATSKVLLRLYCYDEDDGTAFRQLLEDQAPAESCLQS